MYIYTYVLICIPSKLEGGVDTCTAFVTQIFGGVCANLPVNGSQELKDHLFYAELAKVSITLLCISINSSHLFQSFRAFLITEVEVHDDISRHCLCV